MDQRLISAVDSVTLTTSLMICSAADSEVSADLAGSVDLEAAEVSRVSQKYSEAEISECGLNSLLKKLQRA